MKEASPQFRTPAADQRRRFWVNTAGDCLRFPQRNQGQRLRKPGMVEASAMISPQTVGPPKGAGKSGTDQREQLKQSALPRTSTDAVTEDACPTLSLRHKHTRTHNVFSECGTQAVKTKARLKGCIVELHTNNVVSGQATCMYTSAPMPSSKCAPMFPVTEDISRSSSAGNTCNVCSVTFDQPGTGSTRFKSGTSVH